MNGFSFKGVHSSKFGIIYHPESRVLLPAARRNTITVPGRSGVYTQSCGDYEERVESFVCAFLRQQATPTAMLARQIAGWLAGAGCLIFDDEPELYYMATILDAPALHRQRNYGEFTVTYTANPPFALSAEKNIPLGTQGVRYPATVPAPAKLRIHNPNPTAVSNIHIVIRRLER